MGTCGWQPLSLHPPRTDLLLGHKELFCKTFHADKLEGATVESFQSGSQVEDSLL